MIRPREYADTELHAAKARLRLGALVLMLPLSFIACHTSKAPESIPQAQSNRGVIGTVVLRTGREHSGELIVVNDTGYVLLARDRVGIARFGDVARAILPVAGAGTLKLGPNPTPEMLERARLLSRFPFGISAPLLTKLLTASKQEAPDDLARPAP